MSNGIIRAGLVIVANLFYPGGGGAVVGMIAGAVLFPDKLPDGPRMGDEALQVSTYGTTIGINYGTTRKAGNVIWMDDRKEHVDGGGKGGGGQTTYSYTQSFAVAFGEGPITGILRMWDATTGLMYNVGTDNSGAQQNFQAADFRVYYGTEDQLRDPTMQGLMTHCPAYRGQCYIVFTDLALEKYGNQLPRITAEIVVAGDWAYPPAVYIGPGEWGGVQTGTPYFWANDHTGGVYVNNMETEANESTLASSHGVGGVSAYYPLTNSFWVPSATPAADGEEVSIFNTDARIETFGLELSSSSFIWWGNCYSVRYLDTMWLCGTNGVYGFYIDVFGPSPIGTEPPLIAEFLLDYWTYDLADCTEKLVVSIINPNGEISWIDMLGFSIIKKEYLSIPFSHITWDRVREKLIYMPGDDGTYCYIYEPTHTFIPEKTQLFFPVALPTPASDIIYHVGRDEYIVAADSNLYLFNPDDFTWVEIAQDVGFSNIYEVPGITEYIIGTDESGTGSVYKLFLVPRLGQQPVILMDIVSDISYRVGLTDDELDVSELTDEVLGYSISRQGTARSSIEQLMMGFQFDATESGGKVKYVKRGASATITIPSDDLCAHEHGGDVPAPIVLTRTDETELPRNVVIKYVNQEADYQMGAQSSSRQSGRALTELAVELPIVMQDWKAKSVADAALYSAWVGRTSAAFKTTLKYEYIEPTDVVIVEGMTIRIGSKTISGNIIDFGGSVDSGQVFFNSPISGEAAGTIPQVSFPSIGSTGLMLLDIPMLRDDDNDSGFYIAASGWNTSWPGCAVYKSADNGDSYNQIALITTPSIIGGASTVLGSFTENTFDIINTVTVRLRDGGELSSISEDAVLNGGNAALVGNEIIHFKTATLNGDGTYTLSNLLRGRRGTAMSGHALGDRFVFLSEAALQRVAAPVAEIGLERLYKAVTFGQSLASATAIEFTNTAQGLECYSGVLLGVGNDASNNKTITWTRRTRINGEWRDYVDSVLGEASENYTVEIWDTDYTSLKRSISTTSTTASYSSANQVTDFGASVDMFGVRIYQLSETVGTGFVLQRQIDMAKRWWRVRITANNGASSVYYSAAEVQFRTVNWGPSVAVNGVASATTFYPGFPASSAFDGNAATIWASEQYHSETQDLIYKFDSVKNIVQLAFTAENSGSGPGRAPSAFTIDYSNDGVSWTTASSVTGQTGWTAGETRTFSF